MSKPRDVRPLPKDFLRLGVPLQNSIYDAQGHLLMQEGLVLESQSQLDHLYERGLYLDSNAEIAGKPANNKEAKVENDRALATESLTQLAIKNLKVGETLQIKPLADVSGNSQYFVKYIGGMEKKSLICSLPIVDDKVMFIKENTAYSVRMFSGKHVYTFNTMVDVVFTRPYPHMHLKYPREVYTNKLRHNQRVSVNIIATMLNKSSASENNRISGRIIDLSLGGIMLAAPSTGGKAGDSIECSFKISMKGGEALFVIPGILRNITESKQEDGKLEFQHGIQFGEIAFQEKIMLQNHIFQVLTGEKMDDL